MKTGSKDIAYTRIDRTRKIPFTTLDFVRLVSQVMMKSLISLVIANWFAILLKKISTRNPMVLCRRSLEGIYERLRPGELRLLRAHVACLARFFDHTPLRFVSCCRYKINKNSTLKHACSQTIAEPLVDPETGEILVEAGRYRYGS